MSRLVRFLVVALCCLVISLPVSGQEAKGDKAGGQGRGTEQKKAAQTHGRSTQKGSVKKAKKGSTKKTQKQSKKKTRSTKKTAGKFRPSQTKRGAPKSSREVHSTKKI